MSVPELRELNETDRRLTDCRPGRQPAEVTPLLPFAVGAAALLENGTIVTGSNQENAAYPSGTCAERTTVFYANSQYPDQPILTLAIAARNEAGFLEQPISPCGACRQVLLETEQRYGKPMRILLCGRTGVYELQGVKDLLPLSFGQMQLNGEE